MFTEKKCPAIITEGVTIDSLVFKSASRSLIYYFTVEGVIDDAEALKTHDLRGMMLKELKNNANMKDYKDAGYNFTKERDCLKPRSVKRITDKNPGGDYISSGFMLVYTV